LIDFILDEGDPVLTKLDRFGEFADSN